MMKRWLLLCVIIPLMVHAEQINASGPVNFSGITMLDLDTAKRLAVSGNPTLTAAQARIRQAAQRVRQADAAYWPQIDLTAAASHAGMSDNERNGLLQSARFFDPQASIDDPDQHYSAGIVAGWVLFDGFARKFSKQAEAFGEMQQQEASRETRRLLLGTVAETYYRAQLAREEMTIAQADGNFNQRQVTEAQARLRVGTGALSDVLNFKVQVNSARSRLNKARLEYERFLIGLAALMGVADAALPDNLRLSPLASETDQEMALPNPDTQIAEALARRPDLQQSDFRIKQAASLIELARSDFFPKLNFSAELSGARDNDPEYDANDFGYAVGLSVSYNLFSGGIRQAKVSEAVWAQTEAERTHDNLSITVAAEVRKAVADLKRAQAELKLQRANTVLVEKNRDLVEKEYAAGQGTLVRLNEAQRDLITAQSRLALALVSVRQAWENLGSVTGRILDIPVTPDTEGAER